MKQKRIYVTQIKFVTGCGYGFEIFNTKPGTRNTVKPFGRAKD